MVPVFLASLAATVIVVPLVREMSEAECVEDLLCEDVLHGLHANPSIMFVGDEHAAALAGNGMLDMPVSFDGREVPWGLDQIDQRRPKPDGQPINFLRNGTGVVLYSLDTGVNCNEMGSKFHRCSMEKLRSSSSAAASGDPHGHGTAMSLIASTIAKNATLIGIQVLGSNGRGSLTNVLQGLDRVAEIHDKQVPGVILAPLSSNALNDGAFQKSGIAFLVAQAITELLSEKNVATVVSAGNKGIDACTVTPAFSSNAITVAGMKKTPRRAKFSNWGTCADVFAPGTGEAANKIYSGTSVSAAYTAGVAASIASNKDLTAAQVRGALLNNASTYRIKDARGTPQRFVHAPRRRKGQSTIHLERYKTGAIIFIGIAVAYAAGTALYQDLGRHTYSLLPP